jgi:hypothetical protein
MLKHSQLKKTITLQKSSELPTWLTQHLQTYPYKNEALELKFSDSIDWHFTKYKS